jgi:hypothetical protein
MAEMTPPGATAPGTTRDADSTPAGAPPSAAAPSSEMAAAMAEGANKTPLSVRSCSRPALTSGTRPIAGTRG